MGLASPAWAKPLRSGYMPSPALLCSGTDSTGAGPAAAATCSCIACLLFAFFVFVLRAPFVFCAGVPPAAALVAGGPPAGEWRSDELLAAHPRPCAKPDSAALRLSPTLSIVTDGGAS